MPALLSVNFSPLYLFGNDYGYNEKRRSPKCSFSRHKDSCLPPRRIFIHYPRQLSFAGICRGRNWSQMKNGRSVVVKFRNAGGGGGKISSETSRVLGNLALAVFLAYLSMSGQLGWLLDAIVSIWLLAVLVPIVGIGAFLWWAGRDILRGNCPNCGNEFQVFKSMLNEDIQLCPFCSQPFSVEGNQFIKDLGFDQAFDGYSSRMNKGKNPSAPVVDIEAEIRDAE